MARRIPEFWHTFGGTVLGILALGVMTLFNTLHANLADLRREVVGLQESRSAFVPQSALETELAEAGSRLSAMEGTSDRPSGVADCVAGL